MPVGAHQSLIYGCLAMAAFVGLCFTALVFFVLQPATDSTLPLLCAGIGIACSLALVSLLFSLQGHSRAAQTALTEAQTKLALEIQASRAKSTFLGKISHELRTPLNAINGYADVLTQHMFGPLGSPRYDDYALHIRQGGESLLKIVNDLFEIARAHGRDGDFTCEPMDSGIITGRVLSDLGPIAADKDIQLKIDVLPRPIWTYGQREALRQVLLRVIDNAIKYTDSGGTILVAVTPQESEVVLSVTDNGIGISADQLARLNAGAMTGDAIKTHEQAGLGLGLAISRGLIERMGGQMRVESILNRGTRVTFILRAAEPDAFQNSGKAEAAA